MAQGDSTSTARKWYAPDGVTLQFAGNVGMFAAGPSYSFLNDKINAELLYGVVPKFEAEEVLHLLTVRSIFKPVNRIQLSNQLQVTPVRLNLGLSYYFRDQFSTSWDSSYPKNYYWWTSSLRITGGIGAEMNYSLRNSSTVKELSLYGELSTYDLIVTSAIKDPTLTAWDILSFAIGVRAGF
ncbi:hypothetical protein CA264_02660 [Pontibacter actiniarum]|uniref:Outer membrane protein beta-barrel domain-containing protein n=2 Tax=Pontibacter actiniarum TaxID=323450 RepID=A0A1X9YNJ8_9BACT|nr:hypothetical protein CA264_02660 [Pontibacter actiniarum]